ncbi:Ada metal-binding domain-containing protein [Rhodoplanes sp. SY1]|uniref:Ada metal-binding domain-containing protein n=1 Tax=Rhodoplanes sp. SY1 TaxID=3166646 RepID=UPI0038B57887
MTRTYRLLGADRKLYDSASKGTLGGNRRLRIYGRLDCPNALRWIANGFYVKNRVFFADAATAVAAGYRPCAICLRADWLRFKAGETPGRGSPAKQP